jgi:hypothetical protein
MTLKVLKLHRWMIDKEMRDECVATDHYAPIEPVLNRDGLYRMGSRGAWFEVDGKAWAILNTSDFDFELACLNALEYTPEMVEGLQSIKKAGLATRQQIQMLYYWNCAMQMRNTYRSARLHRMRVFK